MGKKSKDISIARSILDAYANANTWQYNEEYDNEYDVLVDEDEDIYDEDDNKFAVILMDELTENNLDSHILLKYPDIANWWGDVLNERKRKEDAKRKAEAARRRKEADEHARKSLIARLTPEEKRLLGVK